MSDREERRRQKEVIELITFPINRESNSGLSDDSRHLPVIDDPLEELLNEFDSYEDLFEEEIQPLTQEDLLIWLGYDPSQLLWLKAHDQEAHSHKQVEILGEIAHRLKFYLDEIEQVLPTKT